ncbi:hypothetical protein [Geodermatophilus sp. CPCC 206100]|uniref:hypothetical protein n=1 Tax=Geodermatophilus sp. CPCC 206100 TaxID=3020054 RepID=UPI003AFFD75E
MPDPAGELHLEPLPDRLRRRDPPVPPDVLALVEAEHARWRTLHDRLVGLIAALLDVAADDGRPVREVVDRLLAGTRVSLDTLVDARIDPAEIAALLRAHGSTGTVTAEDGATVFRHRCGSGQRYWADHPETPTVADGEVPGVPGGRPRYCARCIATISRHGGERWRVDPPADPTGHCTWTVAAGG